MEFEEGTVKPPSTRRLLREQINEQSEHCDVTVKAGEWSKKFHWCILVASPFFEAVYRSQHFKEQSTGIIELHVQQPHTIVEDAILFLYGRRPKATTINIVGLFEMAEFLLIPTLKAQCVEWLKSTDASFENCFQILHLASLFDLYLPSLEEFIRGNLLELLDKDAAVTLDKETIIDMSNDTDLSYVSVKQWFRFLVSWTKADLRREPYFVELFPLLDVSDVDEDLHKEVLGETFVTCLVPSIFDTIKPSVGETTQVIIFPSCYSTRSTVCFLTGSGGWCEIHGDLTDMIGIEDKTSPIVYKRKGYRSSTIIFHNLSCQNENETTTELVDKETASALDDIEETTIVQSKCYAIVCQRVETKQAAAATERERYHYALRRPKYFINLYRGVLQASQTSMEPLVCFLESSVSQLAVDMNNNIAILLQEKDEVIIFNDVECFVERIHLGNDKGYRIDNDLRLTARNSGFVLTSKRLIFFISAVHGKSLHKRYQIEKFSIPEIGVYSKYIVCRNICFRLMRLKYNGQLTFSYTNVDNLKKAMTEESSWVKEDLPDSCKMRLENDIGTFMVTLPKHMLKCSINCPHCVVKEKSTERAAKYQYEDYDFEYEDYYDYDNYCGYDSDDYPYYSD